LVDKMVDDIVSQSRIDIYLTAVGDIGTRP